MSDRLRLVRVIGHLPYASNTTVLAEAADGTAWVYKPERGEQPLWDFPWRSLAAREVLTYDVATAMGLDIVPETVEADGPFGPGSAQRFLDEDADFDPRPLFQPEMSDTLWPVAVLDVVTNNADRKLGHLLRDRAEGKLWAIDNGLTFHPQEKLRTVMWGFSGRRLPDDLIVALKKLEEEMAHRLHRRIADLLTPVEAEITAARVKALLANPVHPDPPLDRPPVPWPVW